MSYTYVSNGNLKGSVLKTINFIGELKKTKDKMKSAFVSPFLMHNRLRYIYG